VGDASFLGMRKGQTAAQLWRMMAALIKAALIAAECLSSAMIQA
jgi:hypothetical protein